MTDNEPRRIGVSIEIKPHAYDPVANPELFEGVLARRLIAFVIDMIILAIPVVLAGIFMTAATIATLGLAGVLFFFLSPLYWPLIVIWALCYYGFTFGSPASATIGMRVMDLEMRTIDGAPCYFALGALHAVAFWISLSVLTPLVLIVAFFNRRGRLLHDMAPAISLVAAVAALYVGIASGMAVIALFAIALFLEWRRLPGDLLLGTVVINNPAGARMIRDVDRA